MNRITKVKLSFKRGAVGTIKRLISLHTRSNVLLSRQRCWYETWSLLFRLDEGWCFTPNIASYQLPNSLVTLLHMLDKCGSALGEAWREPSSHQWGPTVGHDFPCSLEHCNVLDRNADRFRVTAVVEQAV